MGRRKYLGNRTTVGVREGVGGCVPIKNCRQDGRHCFDSQLQLFHVTLVEYGIMKQFASFGDAL